MARTRKQFVAAELRNFDGRNWHPTGVYYVSPEGGSSTIHGLTKAEAEMTVDFLNSCSDEVFAVVQSRLLWSTKDGISKLVDAPYVEGGITIQSNSRLNLAIEGGKIVVKSFEG